MDRLTDGRGDLAGGRPRVPPGAPIGHFIVNGHGGPKMNIDPVEWYRVVIEVARQEVPCRNEAPRRVVIVDNDARSEGSQWRPPDVSIAVAPIYPSRSPDRVWNPNPSELGIRQPASIVKRCPTPLVVALKRPAVIGIDPVAATDVRPKINAHH